MLNEKKLPAFISLEEAAQRDMEQQGHVPEVITDPGSYEDLVEEAFQEVLNTILTNGIRGLRNDVRDAMDKAIQWTEDDAKWQQHLVDEEIAKLNKEAKGNITTERKSVKKKVVKKIAPKKVVKKKKKK